MLQNSILGFGEAMIEFLQDIFDSPEVRSNSPDKQAKIEGKLKETQDFVRKGVDKLLVKSDFQNVRSTLLVSSEKKVTTQVIKERVSDIVGNKNVIKITELKSKIGKNSTYKVDLSTKVASENGQETQTGSLKPIFTVNKFFSGIKESNGKNSGNRIFGNMFVPKSALEYTKQLNKVGKEFRENVPQEIQAQHVFTRTKIDYKNQKIELLVKKNGQQKFVSINDFNEIGFNKKHWLKKIQNAVKKVPIKYIPFKPRNI